MRIKDMGEIDEADEQCIVCEKPIADPKDLHHVEYRNERVTLCCPLCVLAFLRAPGPYVLRRNSQGLLKARLA